MKTNIHLCVAVSERVKLKRSDYPLALRVMQGPCEQVCKVFLTEEDLGEEVTYDVMEPVSTFLASCFMPDIVFIAARCQKVLCFRLSNMYLTFIPPGGAVHQVWDASPAELYHQTEGGGGQRGPETSEKVREPFQSSIIASLVVSTSHINPSPLLSSCTCRYTYLRCMIEKQLGCLPEGPTCRWSVLQNHSERNQENSSNHPAPRVFQSVSIHSELTCAVSVCACLLYLLMSPVIICAFLFVVVHNRGKKAVRFLCSGAERA